MGLPVKAKLIIQRLVLRQSLPDVGYLNSKVEVLELHHFEIELALLRPDVILMDDFTEEFTRVQELLQEESS